MSKINIITYPDTLHNSAINLVLVFPTRDTLSSLQENFLKYYDKDVNVYLFDRLDYNKEEVTWLLNLSKSADYTIVDIDNTVDYFKYLLSYLISNENTYWFCKTDDSIFKHLSSNQIYNLDFLSYNIKID